MIGLNHGVEFSAPGKGNHGLLKSLLEGSQILCLDAQAGGHGMTAKFLYQLWMTFGNKIKGIAHMHIRDRARGAFELLPVGGGKGNGRPPVLLLEAASNQADHPLVPVLLIHTDGGLGLERTLALYGNEGLIVHFLLNTAALTVDGIQLTCHGHRLLKIVAAQAVYTQAHISQSPGGIDAGSNSKAQVKTIGT